MTKSGKPTFYKVQVPARAQCKSCGDWSPVVFFPRSINWERAEEKRAATAALADVGYLVVGDKVLCPDCRRMGGRGG